MNRAEGPLNEFEAGKPGTNARTAAEGAIESLRQKGGIFVEAVRATRMPMALTDPNLPGNPIVFANQAFLGLSGYRMEEVLGQQPHFMNGRLTDPNDAARFAEAIRSDQDDIIETVQYRKDGSRFVATVLISAFKDDDGKVLNHFMSWLDVTRRVEAEDEVTHLQSIQEALRTSEERHTFLLKLGDAIRASSSADAKIETAARLLGERLSASRVLWAEYDWDRNVAIIFDGWFAEGAKAFPTVMELSDYDGEVLDQLKAGQTVRVDDVGLLIAEPAYDAIAKLGVQALLSPPLLVNGTLKVNLSIHQHEPRHWTDDEVALVEEVSERLWAEVVRARSEQDLRESEEQLRLIVEAARDYAIFTVDLGGLIQTWLPGAENVFGWSKEEMVDQPFAVTFTPEDRRRGEHLKELETARQTGSAPDVRWHLRKDGARVFIDGHVVALRNEAGEVDCFLKIGQDTTEKHRTSELQATLLSELQHRVRNTLGILRSIIKRTAANSSSVDEMTDHLQGRVAAFSRVQAMVTRTASAQVPLRDIVDDELVAHAEHESGRIKISGPGINFGAKTAESLSLAIHELATNSVKYGALAGDGRLNIRWSIGHGAFKFSWIETLSGQKLEKPIREGFGTELLLRGLPFDLGAKTTLDFHGDGIEFELTMPLPEAGAS